MTERERFRAIYSGGKVDRIPIYFFGTWRGTKIRWKKEGLNITDADCENAWGPQLPGMDKDWEQYMWNCAGLVNIYPYAPGEDTIEYEDNEKYIIRYANGSVVQYSKDSECIPHTLKYALEPTRASWEKFKTYLNAYDEWRHPVNQKELAKKFAQRDNVAAFMGGSLYGWIREWMGVEELSYFMYDEENLFAEILEYLTNYFIEVHKPFIKEAQFDFVYLFEDCCGSTGPLISPHLYKKYFHKCYRKLIDFYKKEAGVPFVLLDSDGYSDDLIPLWLNSGVDIIFPLEVGTWKQTPSKVRAKFGKKLCILGGIDKFELLKSKQMLKQYLLTLKPEVENGYYIPIPDHRIPPEVSLEKMLDYIEVFNEVFNS